MIGRKNKGIFYDRVGDCGGLCARNVPVKARHMLSIANLVGFTHHRGFNNRRMVRLAMVERPLRKLLEEQQI